MNRELAEVRRYWPRAKQHKFGNYSAVPNWRKWYACLFPWEDGWEISVGEVDGSTSYRHAPTIAEAMRAAGFGVRPLSRFVNGFKRNDCAGRILPGCRIHPHKWFTPLVDRQRHRKGARLGRRKREIARRSYIQQWEDCVSAIDSAAFYVMANTSVPVREVQP